MRTLGRIVGTAALLLALPVRGDDWTSLGRDDGRTRAATEVLVSPAPLGLPVPTGSPSAASPVAADGFLVTAGLDGMVRAFREDDRSLVWSVPLSGSILATPVIDKGRVYVSSSGGAMSVLRLADGASLGSASYGSADQSSPVISGTTLYQGRGFPLASVSALDVGSTAVVWNTPVEQVTNSSPALGGGLVIVGCNSGRYYALDAATGAVSWSFLTPNPASLCSALIDGNSVYLPSGPSLERVDMDPLQWGSSNWSVTCVDPSPPAGALGVTLTASSPAKAGTMIVFLVRFVYALDVNADGIADQRILREFACGVDPAGKAIVWQNLLGDVTVPDANGVPPYDLCPTPAVSGQAVVCVSSVDPTLHLFDAASGSESASFALDAPCLASPIVANARITALTRSGTLFVFEGTTPQPGAATGLAPDGIKFASTPATLSWDSAGPGATYRVRIASDGEILMTWDYEFITTSTSISCPPLPTQHIYTWGVRVQNSALACAPWSIASFTQNVPPAPPGSLTATPKHGRVDLSWTPSPSPTAVGYRVAYGPTGGVLGFPFDVGNVLSTTVSGLTNGTSYTFEVMALDALPDESAPVSAVATPVSAIHIGLVPFDSLAGALAAALPGEIVLLGADTFPVDHPLSLPQGVGLRGVSALDTRLVASGTFVMFDAAAGTSIQLVSLSGGSVGVQVSGSGATIQNCVIRDMTQDGVETLAPADVVNNTIVNNANAGLNASALTQARNNIVQQNGVGFSGLVASRYNDVSDAYSGCAPGPGDLQSPVSFLDAPTGDYREQAQQPSLDTGDPSDDFSQEPALNGGRINMGAFGNTPLAATSLTAGLPSAPPSSGTSGGSCGLLGVEAVLILALARRRR